MKEQNYDFAVVGGSAFAAALALALARKHNRRVCLIGQMPAPLQIARDIALSPAPFSRPDTLRLLSIATGETHSFLTASAFERRNVAFAAFSQAGQDAADHARHMLEAFGVVTTLLPQTTGLTGYVAEGLWSLRPRVVFDALPGWLNQAGVTVFGSADDLLVGQDTVRFANGGRFVVADRLIATDGSCADRLGALVEGVSTDWRMAMRTEPVPDLAGRLIVDIQTGGFLRGLNDGRIEAVAPSGTQQDAGKWLGAFLPPGAMARVVARKRFPVLLSRDGGPVIAPVPKKAAVLATGFGAAGVYFALPLASHLAGAASTLETQWFGARGAGDMRSSAAEIGLVGGGAA